MITSTQNSKVKGILRLQRKASERADRGVFVAEGKKMLLEAPPERIREIYISEGFADRWSGDPGVARLLRECPCETVSDSVFAAMSDTRSPQGVLCLVERTERRPEELTGPGALCLVLENLQDPGNLGTIVRAAEGAGVTGILMSSGTVDIYNPKVIRSTMGSVYRVPFCYARDLPARLRQWKQEGLRLYAAHLKGSRSYDQADCLGPCAFLIGNESAGLSEETASLADLRVRIPMAGQVESLNAAIAASLLVYEAARQRRNKRT